MTTLKLTVVLEEGFWLELWRTSARSCKQKQQGEQQGPENPPQALLPLNGAHFVERKHQTDQALSQAAARDSLAEQPEEWEVGSRTRHGDTLG